MRPRRSVNLRTQPNVVQYGVALAIVAVVVALVFGLRDRSEGPSWLTDTLPPILGVAALVVLAATLGARLRRRR